MFDILTINISVELFGILICLTVIFCRNFLVGSSHRNTRTCFTLMVFFEALVLFASAIMGILTATRAGGSDTVLTVISFLRFAFVYILVALFSDYAATYFHIGKKGKFHIAVWSIAALGIAALSVNLFTPLFYRVDDSAVVWGEYFWVSQLPCLLICIMDLILFFVRSKYTSRFILACFVTYVLLPVAALAVQIAVTGLDLVNIALIIVLMFMFAVMQNRFTGEYIEQRRMLQESRTRLMMSQIKPHFLFNALTSIAQLCDDDPAAAKSTTIAFANYLRGNLTSIEQTKPIRSQTNSCT